MKGKFLSTVACMSIAILLLANVSTVALAQPNLEANAAAVQDDSGSISETDLLYYMSYGAASATIACIGGALSYTEIYNLLLGGQAMGGVGAAVRAWTVPLSAGAGILIAVAIAAVMIGIGFGIYYAVNG